MEMLTKYLEKSYDLMTIDRVSIGYQIFGDQKHLTILFHPKPVYFIIGESLCYQSSCSVFLFCIHKSPLYNSYTT